MNRPCAAFVMRAALAIVLAYLAGDGVRAAESGAAAAQVGGVSAAAWGRITEQAAGLGRFRFEVDRWPADGRLPVPAGFPQIVRAGLVGRSDGVGIDGTGTRIELNAAATEVVLLVPALPAGVTSGTVAVETAEETRQFDDGRIVLTARNAKILPSSRTADAKVTAKLEQQPGNSRIGFWTNPDEAVSWAYQASRWGRYDVVLTYSTGGPDGTEIEVEIGDAKLTGRLAATGSWYRYAVLPLGGVYLSAAGEQVLTVRCTKKTGGAVMNLKSITLLPACEGTNPVQADDGVVTLHGRDATVLGTALRYEPAEKKQTLGFWTRATDAARWEFTVHTPGEFDVEVLQGCGAGQGGSTMAVEFDAGRLPAVAPVEFVVEDTGGFQQFRPRVVGRVVLTAAGAHEVRIVPRKIAKTAACDVRQIRLVPVKP